MTAHGRREWTAALQAGQRTRDAFIRSDWRAAVDWESLYRAPPTAQPSAAQIAASSGCMQSPPGDESCGTITLKNHGLFVDHFSAGHLPFLMDVLTHPQMLQLQRTLLGCSHVLLDHNSLLSRKGGYEGGAWHSHSMNSQNWNPMGPMDGGTPCSPAEYDAQPNFILNLVYPGEPPLLLSSTKNGSEAAPRPAAARGRHPFHRSKHAAVAQRASGLKRTAGSSLSPARICGGRRGGWSARRTMRWRRAGCAGRPSKNQIVVLSLDHQFEI